MKTISRTLVSWLGLGAAVVAGACTVLESEPPPEPAPVAHSGTTTSSTLALTPDDQSLWVVNQDGDSVSVIDTASRALVAEIPLGGAPPAVDPATDRFDPAVMPRSIAIVDGKKVYVAGQASNKVYVIDAEKREVTATIPVPAAPVAVAAAPDGSAVYVVSHEAAQVTRIDTAKDEVTGSVAVTQHPWGVTVGDEGATLYVTHLLLEPGLTAIDAASMTVRSKAEIPEIDPGGDKRIANGVARGLYAAVPRPDTGELWVPHIQLAVKTAQPDLDFESTVFPAVATFAPDGSAVDRQILFRSQALPDAEGSFSDVISGPRAIAFTPDGKAALIADAQSEDVIVFDAESGYELGLVRPIPSALPEGIVIDHAGKFAYVEGRNTHDVTVLAIHLGDPLTPVSVDGPAIDRVKMDPMPAEMRLGQRLFYSANSAALPVTKNFWVACASCHIEGGSDAVTWLFAVGPRDTPSNAGGPINTGFLLRQGLFATVNQYDEINQVEQGGSLSVDNPAHKDDLDALARFVNYGIPLPQNPYLAPDGTLTDAQARGQKTFVNLCVSCHPGAYYTDSAAGNPSLDLTQPIVLHDIGTCVTKGDFPDKPARDRAGNMHSACDFDTPTLRGIFATAPYFHDGSSATLRDVVDRLSFSSGLEDQEKEDLVAYLQTL